MNIYINSEKSPAAVQAKATGSPVSSLRLKRGANLNLSVVVMGSTTACNLRFGIKAKGDYEGSLLAYAESATGQLSDEGMKFDLSLAVTSVALNNAFAVGSGNAATAATLSAVAEFAWQDDGAERLSDTINTTLINDIIRLASDAPEAAAGEYPSPDLVATKSWVNQLKASAAKAGLVLLEADAIIEGEHTAVALTAAGTIAIPLATASESGTVILGTDTPISGRNILPVGKDSSGKLAVSADGLSAFDSAKKAGFVGTEEEWVASLKGEQGEQGEPGPQGEPGETPSAADVANAAIDILAEPISVDIEYSTCSGNDNASFLWAQIDSTHLKSGVLSAITMPCRTNTTGSICTTPVYLSIWQRMQPGDTEFTWIGTSSNTAAQSVGLSSRWEFDNLELNGEDIRICPVNDAELHWDETYVLGGRAIACNDTASSGCRIFSSTANSNHLVELHFEMNELHQRFTPGIHSNDNTIHLTPTEHAELSQLLANKDALLALLASQ